MNRRDFLSLTGCGCCGLILSNCSTAPITGRSQLTILPESMINSQAISAYKQVKQKAKLITDKDKIDPIITVGSRMERAIKHHFKSKKSKRPHRKLRLGIYLD